MSKQFCPVHSEASLNDSTIEISRLLDEILSACERKLNNLRPQKRKERPARNAKPRKKLGIGEQAHAENVSFLDQIVQSEQEISFTENENNDYYINEKKYTDCTNITSVFTKSFGSKVVNLRKKVQPNYFFCIRINSKEIIDTIDACQKDILQNNPHISKALCKIDTMHITLCVMHLKDKNQIDLYSNRFNLHERINANKDEIVAKLAKSLSIKFQGLSTFMNQVVYVDLERNSHYEQLINFQREMANMIDKCGIELTDKKFTPHMTLMKLSKSRDFHKKGIKKIDQSIYKHMKDVHFGVEHVDRVHLCSITQKDEDGFYKIEKSFEFFQI